MEEMSEIQMAQRGVVVIPKPIRQAYNLKAGSRMTLLDLGGVFVLSPQVSDVDKLADRVSRSLAEQGVTLEGMLRTLREERERYQP